MHFLKKKKIPFPTLNVTNWAFNTQQQEQREKQIFWLGRKPWGWLSLSLHDSLLITACQWFVPRPLQSTKVLKCPWAKIEIENFFRCWANSVQGWYCCWWAGVTLHTSLWKQSLTVHMNADLCSNYRQVLIGPNHSILTKWALDDAWAHKDN